MKSTVNSNELKNSKPFPKLMITKIGTIVLFTQSSVGICVSKGDSDNRVGAFFNNWDMSQFTDFNGTVTLQND